MHVTGNILFLVLIAGFLAIHTPLEAQRSAGGETIATLSFSESQVFSGERVTLKIEITGPSFSTVQRPELPEFEGLSLLSANPSTSTSYSIINGVSTRSYSFSYILVASAEGIFEIPPVRIVVDGNELNTNSVQLTVLNRSRATASASLPDMFVKMELADMRPVVGQQILTELVLYFKPSLEVVSYQPSTQWRTDGFWKESLSDGTSPRAETVILGSERYRKAVLQRHSLFPSRSDKLIIGSQTVSVTVRQSGRFQDPFSSFFGGFGTNQRSFELKTDAVELNVQPIEAQSNAETINAVGRFAISRRLSSQTVTIGEALEVITEIRGAGNLALISKPTYTFPEGFEIFQPQESLELSTTEEGISGLKTFRDIVIARRAGNFEIPGTRLAYYDPQGKRYVETALARLPITVVRDPNVTYSFVQDRAFGVQPVTGVILWTRGTPVPILKTWWFWVGLLVPVIGLTAGLKHKRYMDRLENDLNFYRKTKARERAMEKVARLHHVTDVKTVYAGLHVALTGMITDRLSLSEAGLSDQEILTLMDSLITEQPLKKEVHKFIEKCGTIRFAPVTTHQDLKREIAHAEDLINRLETSL